MKRLTSILLALLMLVGMALAEETPDAALGDWYALPSDETVLRLTPREDGTFFFGTEGISGIEGKWRKTTDGEYNLAYTNRSSSLLDVIMSMVDSQAPAPDMTMTARLTESGLDVFYGSTAEGAVVHMARDAEELRTERTPRTDTPLEAFAGTWTMETMFLGTMQLTYTPEMGERQVFCTIDGLTMFPGAGLESFPEGTSFPLTFEDGVLRTTIPLTVQMAASSALVKEIVVDYDLTFFQTADGSLYATLRLNDVPDNPTTMFLLVPMEKE